MNGVVDLTIHAMTFSFASLCDKSCHVAVFLAFLSWISVHQLMGSSKPAPNRFTATTTEHGCT